MTFQLIAYEELTKSIRQSIITLLKSHKVSSVEQLDLIRKNQVCFLQKIMQHLDESTDKSAEDKALVLNAASYYVFMQVKDSYEKSKLFFLYDKRKSDLYGSLYTSLNLREKGNIPDNKDTFKLYSSLLIFMELHTYHPDGLEKGLLLVLPFSIEEIITLDSIVHTLKLGLLVAAEKLHKKQLSDMSASGVKIEKSFNQVNFIESYSNGEKSAIEIGLAKNDELDKAIETNINISESQSCVSSLSQSF